jgi:hypothetical protein
LAPRSDAPAYQRASRVLASKVLAASSANAATQNYVSIQEYQTKPNPALAAVHGQASWLLHYDVPTYYVWLFFQSDYAPLYS